MAKLRYSPRLGHDIRIKPDGKVPPAAKVRPCATAGCREEGAYRVPKSHENLSTYLWFCLAHARAHNEKWDYFAGMSTAEIERFRSEAIYGHRPTWPLGKRAAGVSFGRTGTRIEDGYAVFAEDRAAPRRPERVLPRLQQQAFDVLNLDSSATLIEIKARYKELVKRFHPDTNGGDRGAEERLKQVIKAYGVLRASGLT